MKSLENWIKKNGYEYATFGDTTPEGFIAKGFIVYTDYYGPYPTKEVYALHDKIRAYAKRTKRRCESSHMFTGVRIYA